MDFRNTGKGIALGKVSEEDLLDVNMDTRFRKAIRSEDDVIARLGTTNQIGLLGHSQSITAHCGKYAVCNQTTKIKLQLRFKEKQAWL